MEKKTLDVKMISWFDDHWYKIRYLNDAKMEVEEYFASVTTKLNAIDKPFLRKWYADLGWAEATRRMREAGDRGTRIHFAWQVYCTGGAIVYQNPRSPAYTPEELKEIHENYNGHAWTIQNQDEHYDFLKMVQLHKALQPEIVEAEKKVYNIDHKEAGTADNLFLLKEGEYIISGKNPLKLSAGWYLSDLKTGSTVDKNAYMQVSAYVHCAESMGYERFQGALIAHTAASMKNGIEGLKVHHLTRDDIDQYYSDYRDIARVWERQFATAKPLIRQLPCLVALPNENVALQPEPEPKPEPEKEPPKKEEKSKKTKYLDSVLLTKDEFRKLYDKFGGQSTEEKIRNLNNYIMSKGKKYKSHYHTILSWERDEETDAPQKKAL